MSNSLPATGRNPSRTMAMAGYILLLLSFLTLVTWPIAALVAYVNRGTGPAWLDTHYTYQIRTFWISLVYTVIGFATLIFLIGYLILFLAAIWMIVRCIKGMSSLDRHEPVDAPLRWGW